MQRYHPLVYFRNHRWQDALKRTDCYRSFFLLKRAESLDLNLSFISDILFKYDAYSKRKLENLNKEIAIGLEQANRGESIEFDFDELMQEVDDEFEYTQ